MRALRCVCDAVYSIACYGSTQVRPCTSIHQYTYLPHHSLRTDARACHTSFLHTTPLSLSPSSSEAVARQAASNVVVSLLRQRLRPRRKPRFSVGVPANGHERSPACGRDEKLLGPWLSCLPWSRHSDMETMVIRLYTGSQV